MSATITLTITCEGDFIEGLREQGLLFETIADTLDIPRENIQEV